MRSAKRVLQRAEFALERRGHRPVMVVRPDAVPVEYVAGVLGDVFGQNPLGPAVAFAERMHRVEIDHHISGAVGKFLARQTA